MACCLRLLMLSTQSPTGWGNRPHSERNYTIARSIRLSLPPSGCTMFAKAAASKSFQSSVVPSRTSLQGRPIQPKTRISKQRSQHCARRQRVAIYLLLRPPTWRMSVQPSVGRRSIFMPEPSFAKQMKSCWKGCPAETLTAFSLRYDLPVIAITSVDCHPSTSHCDFSGTLAARRSLMISVRPTKRIRRGFRWQGWCGIRNECRVGVCLHHVPVL